MERVDLWYGVKIGPIQELPVMSFERHPANFKRSDKDSESSTVFTAEMKQEGAHHPIIAVPSKGKHLVVQGMERLEAYLKYQDQLDLANRKIQAIKKTLLPIKLAQNAILKDLHPYGGLNKFIEMIEKKKKKP